MPALPLNMQSGMPQMRAAFIGWMVPITLVRVTQQVVQNGLVEDIETNISFQGTVQPLSAEEIELKPDAQRSFEWLQIHALAGSTNLVTDDRIIFAGVRYKIMARKDYSLNNYVEYHAIQDYTQGNTP